MLDFSKNIFQNEFVVRETFHEIAWKKIHVIEFREIEDMRFQKYGCGHVERGADFGKIGEKLRIHHFSFLFVYELFADLSAFYRLCPDSHRFRFSPFIVFPYPRAVVFVVRRGYTACFLNCVQNNAIRSFTSLSVVDQSVTKRTTISPSGRI